jgi:SPP1 family predicted phage head-tail adaptor
MQSGKLRHRVQIQSRTQTQDQSTGEIVDSWSTVATVYASIETLSVRDFIAAKATQTEITARIKMRARSINVNQRIVHKTTIYDVQGVLPDNDSGSEYITIAVNAGVNNG